MSLCVTFKRIAVSPRTEEERCFETVVHVFSALTIMDILTR